MFRNRVIKRRSCRAICVIAIAAAGWRAAPGESSRRGAYVGSTACAKCHSAQFEAHAKTGHARSLRKAAAHPLVASMLSSDPLVRPPDYRFRFRLSDGQFRVEGRDARGVMDIPVDWAFGAGDQAVTFVSRISPDWYLEHYYSFYAALGRMAPTPGQGALEAKTLPTAMGLPYKASDPATGVRACFECHSTGPLRVNERTGFEPGEPGVGCEACHGAGQEHAAAAARDPARARRSILNPKRLPAAALNDFCGRCHRPPSAPAAAIDWSYSWNVRHQPAYLSQSRCMQESRGKLSCFTCHEPHRPLRRGVAFYNARCVACHARDAAAFPAQACTTDNRPNCVDCHMPRVSPQPALRFTNHWIGVYGEGSKLKPR